MVIHCGDFTNSHNIGINNNEAVDFLNWYSSLNIKHKILTGGNHDSALYYGMIRKEDWPEITILINESANIEGVKVFCSPYSPRYGDWVFMEKRNRMDVIWNLIPDDTDILAVHTMPKSILDLTRDENNNLIQVGCKSLYNKILEVKPKIFCGGHLHSENQINNFGIYENFGIKFINAACLNHKTKEFYNGHVIEI